jgi:outer membrane protein assembly factor BamB
MTKHKWILTLIISAILILSYLVSVASSTSASSTSNEWTMFRQNPNHNGYTTSNSSTNSVKPLWNYTTGRAVWSSPAVANGYVFVGSKDYYIYCLNASDGRLVWKSPTGGEVNSSPAVDNGRVYVGSKDGWLYCLDIATGKPYWIVKVGIFLRSSPVVLNGRVYIGSGNQNVSCLDAIDGNTIWSHQTALPVESSPAVSDGVVYVATDDYCVYALNASTGNEIWHSHTGSTFSSPSVSNGYVYIGSYEGYICALNDSTGDQIWEYQTNDEVASSPAVAYGFVYVGSENNNLYCLNATSGQKVWESANGYWVWSSPTVADGNVYVGSEDYNLYCFSAFTGAKQWSYPTGYYVDSSPAIVNNTLYVGSDDYHLYAFTLCNSTVQPPEYSNSLSLNTIAFDVISFTVGAAIIFVMVLFVHSNRQANQKPKTIDNRDKKAWFYRHADALCILVIIAFSTFLFVNLGSGPLWAADEQTYSQWAFHMVKSADYLAPSAFGAPAVWIGKPPLFMWLISLAYQFLGVNNFTSRFWSSIFGALSLVLVFYFGKRLYNRQVGFLSAVVLGTFTTFYEFARRAMTDIPFLFFVMASIYFFVLSEKEEKTSRYIIVSGLFFGLALMTKQVQALLIPLIIISYIIFTKRSMRFLFTKPFARFVEVAILIFVPWLIYMTLSYGPQFWQWFFIYCEFTRTMSPIEGHVGGYLFYFNYLATNENLLWVVLLPFAATFSIFNSAVKRIKEDTLILIWIAIVLIVFTFAQTKIYWYILPAFPAFAIAISNFLYQLSKKISLALHKLV